MATHLFVGNLVDAPDFRFTDGGVPSLRMRIAVNDSYRDEHGEWKTRDAVFWDAYAWRKAAELIHEAALRKGQNVIVEARIESQSWQTEAGERHTRQVLQILNCGLNLVRPLQNRPTADTTQRGQGNMPENGSWEAWADTSYSAPTAQAGSIPGVGPTHAESAVGL